MYREKTPSLPQKAVLILLHLGAVLAAVWLLFDGGIEAVGAVFGQDWPAGDPARRALLLAFSAVYFVRTCLTLFWFLRRKIAWSEALTIGGFAWIIHVAFALLGGTQSASLGPLDALAIALYAFGSYLNTGSEYQRHRWKQRPENRGHLYMDGLFRWARHINYFGDLMLFCGFALLTGRVWAFAIPLVMMLGFIFVNVPMLDAYLQEKYGGEFQDWKRHSKRFIPWVY